MRDAVLSYSGQAVIASAGTTLLAAVSDWPSYATTAVVAVGVAVTGGLAILAKVDRARIERKKAWDEANKASLTEQLKTSCELVASIQSRFEECQQTLLHERADNRRHEADKDAEIGSLRNQFIELAKQVVSSKPAATAVVVMPAGAPETPLPGEPLAAC